MHDKRPALILIVQAADAGDVMASVRFAREQRLLLAVRFTFTGTHEGELLGAPGTGRPLKVEGIAVLHFENGLGALPAVAAP